MFDVPDLAVIDDAIVNGTFQPAPGNPLPLAPFTAQRVDYSLYRLPHYTATGAEYFQNFVIFTNYQFYVDEFVAKARAMLPRARDGYEESRRTGQPDHPCRLTASPAPALHAGAAAADAGLSI